MTVLTKAEEISDIAFGFMGSKALFAALHHDVFTNLSDKPLSLEAAADATGLHPERLRTVMTALISLGLVTVEGGRFADPEAARLYSDSQHAGSLGPALGLSKSVDLSDAKTLLDVGGGTGAFAITLCQAFPGLSATIIDFPNVAAIGAAYVEDAGLTDRISYIEGDALETPWPHGQNVILASYLFSGILGERHEGFIARAHDHLAPDGRLLIHDFVVSADRTGPKLAALWQLQHTAFTPHARSLDDGWLKNALAAHGFSDVSVEPMIPGMTMLAQGRKAD